jgi:hypothetical protein
MHTDQAHCLLIDLPPEPAAGCDCCVHSWQAHDAMAQRFCGATMAMAHIRGCICRPTAEGRTR